jgi:nitroreductase
MEFIKVLQKRKAVRKFTAGKSIPRKDITKILNCINLAPSAKNLQSYKVFAVKDKETIHKIFLSCYNQRSDFINNALLILIFCTDPGKAEEVFFERGKNLYSLQDATIAATYGILSAVALGYATCWVGNFKEEEVKKVLQTEFRPIAAIMVGRSNENPDRPPRIPLQQLAKII